MENTACKYKIVKGTEKDIERVNNFMKKYFFPDEPIHSYLGLSQGHTCTKKPLCAGALKEGRSLLAITSSPEGEDEEIIGICLNGESTQDEEFPEDLNRCSKHLKIKGLIGKVIDDADIWKSTGFDRALDIHVLSVHSEMRRNGVAKALVEYTSKMAAEEGFPILSITCTSKYSADLVEKMGMKCLAEIKYDEYLDENGVPVFKPPEPHDSVKTFVKML